jgi:hypothetical protein
MVMSWDQNVGRIHSVRTEEFKYLGTTLTNQKSIPQEIKSRLRSGNACYHSVQNLLSSRSLSKNFTGCFVWVWNLVTDIAGRKETEGVWEHGVEENILT